MSGFVVHDLAPDVTVQVTRAMPPIPPRLDAEIELLWQAAAARVEAGGAGRLFNGSVFSVDQISPHAITGHLTEYRRLVAQMENHDLFPALGIRSLSVCGVLCCPDGILIGRRPEAAIYQPGMWQLPPAGSIDERAIRADGSADLAAQLLLELAEETGLSPEHVGSPIPLCVVEHPGSHVSDCGLALTTALRASEILTLHREHGNAEYGELVVVSQAKLAAFVTEAGDHLVPPAREFLFRLGLLDQGLSPPGGP